MVWLMDFSVDGACKRNGEWDAVAAAACCRWSKYDEEPRERAQVLRREYGEPPPTNQQAEITAIIMALEWACERYRTKARGRPSLRVTIRSDSRYAVNCLTDWVYGWQERDWINARGTQVANRDLIEKAVRLENAVRKYGSVEYKWVPRDENALADEACKRALDEEEDDWCDA